MKKFFFLLFLCFFIKIIYAQEKTLYNISGEIYVGNNLLPKGKIILFYKNINAFYEAKYITDIDTGKYEFSDIKKGEYLLYSYPIFDYDFNYTPIYFPTYFGNKLFWRDANLLNLESDTTNINIDLLKHNLIYGNNSISGQVSFLNYPDYEGDTLGKINDYLPILLLDATNNEALSFAFSNSFLQFEMNNLPYGTYNIYMEKAGFTTYPITVNLSQNQLNISDLQIILDNQEITASSENLDFLSIEKNVKIYPNPVKDLLIIEFPFIKPSNIKLKIYNMLGEIIFHENLKKNKEKIILSTIVKNLQKGIYFIEIEIDKSQKIIKKIVK